MDLDRDLYPWSSKATGLIARRVADAAAHARSGRSDLAHERLQELRQGLVGERRDSPTGLLRDARASFYRAAFADHSPTLDPAFHQTEAAASPDGEAFVKTSLLFGDPQWHRLEALLSEARRHLAVAAAAMVPMATMRETILSGWEARHREAITRFAHGALSDDQMTLHNVVGLALVKPEFR